MDIATSIQKAYQRKLHLKRQKELKAQELMKSKQLEKEKSSQIYELDCMIYEESLTRYYCLQMMELEYNQLKTSIQQQKQQQHQQINNLEHVEIIGNDDDNVTMNIHQESISSEPILLPKLSMNDTSKYMIDTNSDKLKSLNNGDTITQAILKLTEKLPQHVINGVLSEGNGVIIDINGTTNEDQIGKRIKIENNIIHGNVNVNDSKSKTPPLIFHLHNSTSTNNSTNIINTNGNNIEVDKVKNKHKRLKIEENKTTDSEEHAN